jgi:hypothetical protein
VEQTHRYKVRVSDNFHYMDEEEVYDLAEFDSCEAAMAACRKVIDDFLLSTYKPRMSADELWSLYTTFGDDAYILSRDTQCRFSGWTYAKQRCQEVCAPSS